MTEWIDGCAKMIPLGGNVYKEWHLAMELGKDFGLHYSRMGYLQDVMSYSLGHGFIHSLDERMNGRMEIVCSATDWWIELMPLDQTLYFVHFCV
jgi:hypothetical protein